MSQPPTTAPNLAPIRELDRARKQPQFQKRKLDDLLVAWRQELRKEGETQEWINRILGSQANELFYRGYQKLRRADIGNTWRVLDPKPVHFTLNEFQFWINVNVAKWLASRVEFRVTGLPDDSEDQEAGANKLRQIAQYYDQKDWDRTLTALASKGAQFTAYLIAYVYYNPNAGTKAFLPVIERKQVGGGGAYRCADCGNVGEIESPEEQYAEGGIEEPGSARNDQVVLPETNNGQMGAGPAAPDGGFDSYEEAARVGQTEPAPTCSNCGSTALDVTSVPAESFDVKTGTKAYDGGDVEFRLLSLYNVRFNAALGLEKSPIVLWEEEHENPDLEASYPGLDLEKSNTTDHGLQAKANLEHTGRERNAQEMRTTLSRLWVEPWRYQTIELEADLETQSGGTFPAGTRLIDLFPKGLHAVMAGKQILDLYGANKNEDLCVMEYHSMPSGGLAQGVDAMREPQRQTNTVYSLMNLWARHHAAPPKRYNPTLIDPGDMSGDLTRPIPVNAENLGLNDGATMENAIVTDAPTPMPNGVFEYAGKLREFIQFAANATDFSDGLPGANNDTLGGARIGQSLSQAVSGTVLAQFSDFRAAIAERRLRKFRRHCWDERYIQFAGKYGITEKLTLSASQIPEDFRIEAVPGSWVPRTPEQKQANMQALLMAAGGWPGLLAMPPELQAEMCEIYDVRLDTNALPIAIRTARMRIKQMTAFLPILREMQTMLDQLMPAPMAPGDGMNPQAVSMPGDPMAQPGAPMQPQQPMPLGPQLLEALQPKFNPRERGCAEAAEYLSSWFTMDEGLTADPDLIEGVGALQDLYLQAAQIQQMVRSSLEMAGQPTAPTQPGQEEPGKGKSKSGGAPAGKPQMGAIAPAGG